VLDLLAASVFLELVVLLQSVGLLNFPTLLQPVEQIDRLWWPFSDVSLS